MHKIYLLSGDSPAPLCLHPQANAGVKVSMADGLEKNQNFLVTTDIYYWKPKDVM